VAANTFENTSVQTGLRAKRVLSAQGRKGTKAAASFRNIGVFLKKPNPVGFWVLLGFRLYWVFHFLYLNEHLGSLLVDLAHS